MKAVVGRIRIQQGKQYFTKALGYQVVVSTAAYCQCVESVCAGGCMLTQQGQIG